MDVHGTKLGGTLFTTQCRLTKDGSDSQKRHALCKEKSKGRAAFDCSSSQALGLARNVSDDRGKSLH
jgi:hypothetical protein